MEVRIPDEFRKALLLIITESVRKGRKILLSKPARHVVLTGEHFRAFDKVFGPAILRTHKSRDEFSQILIVAPHPHAVDVRETGEIIPFLDEIEREGFFGTRVRRMEIDDQGGVGFGQHRIPIRKHRHELKCSAHRLLIREFLCEYDLRENNLRCHANIHSDTADIAGIRIDEQLDCIGS